jgi:hypothetical protein
MWFTDHASITTSAGREQRRKETITNLATAADSAIVRLGSQQQSAARIS